MIWNSSLSADSGAGTAPAASYSTPLWTSSVASPPSSRIMFGPPSGHVSACSVHHQYSSSVSPFQAKTGTPAAAIAAAAWSCVEKMLHEHQRTSAPSAVERLDQHGRLHRHVQRAGDARALERLRGAELLAQRHQAGHLVLGELDLLAAEVGEADVGDLVVGRAWWSSRLHQGRGSVAPRRRPAASSASPAPSAASRARGRARDAPARGPSQRVDRAAQLRVLAGAAARRRRRRGRARARSSSSRRVRRRCSSAGP